MKDPDDAARFAERLIGLLKNSGHERHGAGAYLASKYKVSTVTANAWLNGEHKPGIPMAKKIARDHGMSFDKLYFGTEGGWPFSFDRGRFDALTPGQKVTAEGALLGAIVDMEATHDRADQKSRAS